MGLAQDFCVFQTQITLFGNYYKNCENWKIKSLSMLYEYNVISYFNLKAGTFRYKVSCNYKYYVFLNKKIRRYCFL